MENRNLSILFTDMKGFTLRTSSQSRGDTLQMIKHHKEILLPVIQQRGGRLIKTIGDAFLVVFESPTEAVLAGMDLQETLRRHNASAPPQEKIEIRAAVNSGEVILEEGDVYGEAVNIASRVQGVAEPNEVYFTESTYLSMNKSEVPSSEIGYRILKGLPQKIKLYKVLRENSADKNAAGASHAVSTIVPTWRRAAAFLTDLLLLGLVTGLVFAIPFSRQIKKYQQLKVQAETWAASSAVPAAQEPPKTGEIKQEIETLQKEIGGARAQLTVKQRDLEAAQIDLDEKRKLLDRDQELFDQKSEASEAPETDEVLIREETELRRRSNLLDKEQDSLYQNGTDLEIEEKKISGREELMQQKIDQLNEITEASEESAAPLPRETVEALLWGSGPVLESFPQYDEVTEFRSERSALAAEDNILRFAFLILGILLFLIYHTVFFAGKGATPGKSLLHLKVCGEDGKPLGLGRSFARSLCYLFSALPLGLGFFWIRFDSRHRTWHDKLTGSKVISNA